MPGATRGRGRPARAAASSSRHDPLLQPGQRLQERHPGVGDLARQPHGGRTERGQVQRHRRRGGQPQPAGARSTVTARSPSSSARTCRAVAPSRRTGARNSHVVQALGELRAARAEAEGEPAAGHGVQARRQHRDARRAAPPHVEHAGAQLDPRRCGSRSRRAARPRRSPSPRPGERAVAEVLGDVGERAARPRGGSPSGSRRPPAFIGLLLFGRARASWSRGRPAPRASGGSPPSPSGRPARRR